MGQAGERRQVRAEHADAAGRRAHRRRGARRPRDGHRGGRPGDGRGPFPEIAGPRAETLVGVASLVAARRGEKVRVEGFTDPADPDRDAYANGGLLPGAHAILAGPSYEEWLDSEVRK